MLNIPFKNSILSWVIKKRIHQIELFKKYPIDAQKAVFWKLIKSAKQTKFGKDHGFKDIDSYEDFKNQVPIRPYEDFYIYIEMLRKGKEDILWPGKTKWFAKSSGTTNAKSKYIPITIEALEDSHYKAGKDMLCLYCSNHENSNIFNGKGLMLGGSQEKNSIYNFTDGDLSAILIDNFPFWVRMHRVPDSETALMGEWEDKIEKISDQAMNEDITNITGVPSWMLLLLNKIIEKKGVDNLIEVWPNLELYIHGGVNFAPYKNKFETIIPSKKMNYLEVYNASEGMFAIQDQNDSKEMLLMLDYGIFYEFIPMETFFKNQKVIDLSEVELNKDYAIIISTNTGLWRYIIGDTVKFTSINPYRITIVGRTKSFINAFGEELVVENAETALEKISKRYNAIINEYTAYPVFKDSKNAYHEWLIEFSKPPLDIDNFQVDLDVELQNLNSDYEAKRNKNLLLSNLKIKTMEKGTFYNWLKENNRLGGQNKIRRLSNDDIIAKQILCVSAKFSTK